MSKKMIAKKGLSEMSRDSAIAGCDDEYLENENEDINNPNFLQWPPTNLPNKHSWSRSSSISSICSCMSCAAQGNTEWKRRPSRLLEAYDVEDFYKFDEVLGNFFLHTYLIFDLDDVTGMN